jgi:hypothetical protein
MEFMATEWPVGFGHRSIGFPLSGEGLFFGETRSRKSAAR